MEDSHDYIKTYATFYVNECDEFDYAKKIEMLNVIHHASESMMIELFETNSELAYHMMAGVAGQYKRTMDIRTRMIIQILEKNPELNQRIDDIEQLTPAY
jgi:hypothetical protein